MSGKVFRAGVHDQINAEVCRTLIDRRSKCAVDKSDELVLPRQCNHFIQINHSQQRIGRRLQIEQAGVGLDGAGVLIVLIGGYKGGFNTKLGQPLAEELRGPAINVALGDHMVAALQQRKHRGGDGSHTGSKQQRRIGAFQFGNRFFRHGVSGIAVAGVEHVRGGSADLLIAVRNLKGGSLIDRSGQRPVLLFEVRAAANRFGLGMVLVCFHAYSFR